ncbi:MULTISPECIES: GNAT family N-acetyltransferase [Idiomarina]|uniref:GNAT family N-acetyltransferase n=1 Tax=Idiomarina TaxID=135575 RepID=UPI000C4CF082|nr:MULTISPECIES: GNAT family N-acetyltransferase [Idiomarina]MAO67727.1 GNAT family N-acetyltransferase [Idiomarina sp.]MBF79399.1 GNAT family N-acetyltransferase [Idiomarina sp.]
MPELILPIIELESSYRRYINELGEEERYPFPLDFEHDDFPAMLRRIDNFKAGVDIPDGFVQSSTYWLVDNNEIIGCTNIRHCLNDRIEYCGGHIGLGIRPSYRGMGLGKVLLKQSIEKATELGINPLHIHCHTNNVASCRMIESCGGKLSSTVTVGNEAINRYLIHA